MVKIKHILVLLFISFSLYSQELSVPVNIQMPIIFKILTYTRSSKLSAANPIRIAIFYQKSNRYSLETKNYISEMIEQPEYQKLDSRKIIYSFFSVRDEIEIQNMVNNHKIDIAYILPLKSINLDELVEIFKKEKILCISSVAEYVMDGLPIGIGTKGDKPLIMINLSYATETGIEFNSQLLKIAKVIK